MEDELVLAAVRRAVLHGPAGREGAPAAAVLAHLAIPRRTARDRALRARLRELERTGELWRGGTPRAPVWRLAPAGVRRLAVLAAAGRAPALPESPQHLAWRRARVASEQELPRFAARLAADLAEAEAMLAALADGGATAPHSDRWLVLGRTLAGDCRRIGSAWHCLHEWPRPDEQRADRDGPLPGEPEPPPALRALRAGRRNLRLWSEPD